MPTLRSRLALSAITALAGLLWAAPAFAVSRPPAARRPPVRRHSLPIPTAEELFVKVLRSEDAFAYRGRQITTYWRTGRAGDTLVFHAPPDNQRIYSLNPESQHGRLLVSDGRQQWEYDPHRKTLNHRRLSSEALDDDDLLSYQLLRVNYLLAVDPKPRTWADRRVYVITVKRPKGGTLARRFWIDNGSGVILKREIYGDNGRLAVTESFSDITYHPKLPPGIFSLANLARSPGVRLIESRSSAEEPVALDTVAARLGGKAFAPPTLTGYRLVGASAKTVGGRPLLHLRYSDGLNLVSLFEQQRTQARRPTLAPGMQRTQIGSVPAHISHRASLTTLNWDTPTLNVTLMGELGVETLRALALAAVRGR